MIIQEKLTNSLMKTYAETNGKRFYIKKLEQMNFMILQLIYQMMFV